MVFVVGILGIFSVIVSLILSLIFHLTGWQLFIFPVSLSCLTAYYFWKKTGYYYNEQGKAKKEYPLTSVLVGFWFGLCLTVPITVFIDYIFH